MFYDPRSEPHGLPRNPWTAMVTPRPIGWISSLGADGVANLAPYSCFGQVSSAPPCVMFTSTPRKHSLTNIEATGEFVANLATWDLRAAMNLTSAVWPEGTDEFDVAGLEKAPCRNVRVPRVAASPIALECVVNTVLPITPRSGAPSQTTMVIGEVVGIHIDDAFLTEGRVDTARIKPLARLGYMDYLKADDLFEMLRPEPPKV